MTLWSEWAPVFISIDDRTIAEKRDRFVCTVDPSTNHSFPQIKSDKIIYRICNDKNGADCRETGKTFDMINW